MKRRTVRATPSFEGPWMLSTCDVVVKRKWIHLQRCVIVTLSPTESENGLATRFIICEINSRLWGFFSWPLWILGDLVLLCEVQLSRFSSQDEIRPLIKLNLWISRQQTSEHVLKSKITPCRIDPISYSWWIDHENPAAAHLIRIREFNSPIWWVGFVHSLNLNRPVISQNDEIVNIGFWKIVNVMNWRVRCGTITRTRLPCIIQSTRIWFIQCS